VLSLVLRRVRGVGGAAGENEASLTCASVFGDFGLAAVFFLGFGGLRFARGLQGTVREGRHRSLPEMAFIESSLAIRGQGPVP